MADKVFNQRNYETKDNTQIHFTVPKVSKNGLKMNRAYYLEDGEKLPISFETNQFILVHGVQKTQTGTYYIDVKLDETNQTFLEFISEMDELGAGKTWENSKKWFGNQMDQDVIDEYYKSLLKTSKNSEPYVRLKLDTENLVIKNQHGKLDELDSICSNSKVVVKVRYDGLSFFKQLFTPTYTVYEIKYYQTKKKNEDGDSFYEQDNAYPDLVNDLDSEGESEDSEELLEEELTFKNYENHENIETHSEKVEEEHLEQHHEQQSEEQPEQQPEQQTEQPEQPEEQEEQQQEQQQEQHKKDTIGEIEEVSVRGEEEQETILVREGDLDKFLKENVEEKSETENIKEVPLKNLTKLREEYSDVVNEESTINLGFKDGDTMDDVKRKLMMYEKKLRQSRTKTEKTGETTFSETRSRN